MEQTNIALKVSVKGIMKSTGLDTKVVTEVTCNENDLQDVVGKVLYSHEQQGFGFNTHDVYTDIFSELESTSITKSMKMIIATDIYGGTLSFSVKRL